MSAALAVKPRSATEAAAALLRAVARGSDPARDSVRLIERQPNNRTREQHVSLFRIGETVPDPVLRILEEWTAPISVPVAIRGEASVLAVSKTFHRELARGRWGFDRAAIESWESRVREFRVPPSMIVRSLPSAEAGTVTAIWFLDGPYHGDRVVDASRGLAHALEASVPTTTATVDDLAVPLPGSQAMFWGRGVVSASYLDERRVATLDEVVAAIRAAGRK